MKYSIRESVPGDLPDGVAAPYVAEVEIDPGRKIIFPIHDLDRFREEAANDGEENLVFAIAEELADFADEQSNRKAVARPIGFLAMTMG
jgi:hypothetical protein